MTLETRGQFLTFHLVPSVFLIVAFSYFVDSFPLTCFFLIPFVELKYGKRMIPVKLIELTTREVSDVVTIRFKSHAKGRRI